MMEKRLEKLRGRPAKRSRSGSRTGSRSRSGSRTGSAGAKATPPAAVVPRPPPQRVSRLDPNRVELDLQLWAVYKHIVATTETWDVFAELPSKKDYPNYYKYIDEPICLNDIRARVLAQQYHSVRAPRWCGARSVAVAARSRPAGACRSWT